MAGASLRGIDLRGAHIHDVNLEGAQLTDAWLVGADISGVITGLRINEVEVGPLISAELDRRYPERVKLRPSDVAGLHEAWLLIEAMWGEALGLALRLPELRLHERVGGEWSFLETLRHLIFATDSWVFRMVLHDPAPYHHWGVAPAFLTDPAALGIDPSADPGLADVLAARAERMQRVAELIDSLNPGDLDRVCAPPDDIGHPLEPYPLQACLRVVLDEEWAHCRYATRDLRVLLAGKIGPGNMGPGNIGPGSIGGDTSSDKGGPG